MLSKFQVHPTIPVADLSRAAGFYEKTLGFSKEREAAGGIMFRSGSGSFTIYPTPNAGKAAHTLMSFAVGDLDTEMAELRERGVTFEEYDLPGLKTTGGVAELDGQRGAWFKDSEGNIIAVVQLD